MQALLKLLIFLVLLTKGASLVCDRCYSKTMKCDTIRRRCPSSKDECYVKFSEQILEGKVEQFLEKGCERSPFCPYDQIQLYLGKGRYYKSGLLCCHDRTCQKNVPKLPTTETIPNGKQCPACFSWSKTCEPELIECTGSNIYCFNMTSIIDESDQIMMGCASTSACNFFRSRTASLLIEGVKSAVCESTDSRGMRSTSFSLLAFSGILLMKLFS